MYFLLETNCFTLPSLLCYFKVLCEDLFIGELSRYSQQASPIVKPGKLETERLGQSTRRSLSWWTMSGTQLAPT